MIYLDSAATSFIKPLEVISAVENAMFNCASAGRGGYHAAASAAAVLYSCRETAAEMFGIDSPEKVIFTYNATHALNIAIKSLARRNAPAVISGYEHNAVLRPLNVLKKYGIQTKVAAAPLFDSDAMVRAFERQLASGAAFAVCTHVSNVFGYILPIARIDAICAAKRIPLIIDASQSAGCIPLDCSKFKAVEYVCMPGHKGLLGPQGTGMLLCCGSRMPSTIIEGGTGSMSEQSEMPQFLPDRLEAGTINVPGIAGLDAGMKFIKQRGIEEILKNERNCMDKFMDIISDVPNIKVFSNKDLLNQSGVLSFYVKDRDCEDAARDFADAGIAVRAGLHCAPLAHKTAGTLGMGTVRVSFGALSTAGETVLAAETIKKVLNE